MLDTGHSFFLAAETRIHWAIWLWMELPGSHRAIA